MTMTFIRTGVLIGALFLLAGGVQASPISFTTRGPEGLATDPAFNEYEIATTTGNIDGPGTYFYDSVFISIAHPSSNTFSDKASSETGRAALVDLKIGTVDHQFWVPYSVTVTTTDSQIMFGATSPVEYNIDAADDFVVTSLAATFDYTTSWNALLLGVSLAHPVVVAPVQEPTTMAVLAVGLLGLGVLIRNRLTSPHICA
jgi:hypothetical protein